MGTVTSMNFATVVAVISPKNSEFPPVTFKADGFFHEEEFLSEPQPDKDRARLFMSNDGNAGEYIDNFAISGKRDITIFDGAAADALQKMAFSNPQPIFDLSFTYSRNDQDAAEIRTHLHTDCKFMNHPARAMSNDIATVKFSFKYAKLSLTDIAGNPVS